MTEIVIRRAGLADIRSIGDIERQSFITPWSRWSFLAELSNPVGRILVASPAAGRRRPVWGYLVFWLVADEMHIMNLAVNPRQRCQGIARRLLQEGLSQARGAGAKVAWLEVRPSNTPALALYKSFGFREVGRRRGYYQDTREDALLLALDWEPQGGEGSERGG